MTPLEFVSMSEEDLRTLLKNLLENTNEKLETVNLKEVIGSIVPIVELDNDLGVVFKKKIRIHTFGPSIILCSYLHYIICINLVITSKITGEFLVERYLMEGEKFTRLQ